MAGARDVIDYARSQRDAMVDNEPGARRGDADAVHDMRVAIRRLRSTLRTFRGLWDRDRSEALRAELKWLAHELGPVRDSQVMAGRLGAAIQDEPPELVVGPVSARVDQRLTAETSGALERFRAALDGDRYPKLRGELDALVAGEPPADRGKGWVRRRVRRALRRADRMLDAARSEPPGAAGSARPAAPDGGDRDAGLHEARKAYKRARYGVEVLAGRAGRPARRLAKRISRLQDVLGTHQDTVITREVLRDHGARAERAGESTFTYGLLYGRQRAAAAEMLQGLPDAVRRSRRRRVRRWLRN